MPEYDRLDTEAIFKSMVKASISKKYNTRIAPSPTGHAHIGTFRTAYFCWLAARASNGRFLLRIDDTDTSRNKPELVNPIYESLEWLELNWDATFRQSERASAYQNYAIQLVNSNLAVILDNGAIALKWHPDMPKSWHDNIAGDIPITQTNIDQINEKLILLKGDEAGNAPTYQFSSTVDDFDFDINYIIRGTDHTSNTPKQLAIWWALNVSGRFTQEKPFPEFAHVGLLFKDKKKISKRDGASSILEYRDKGYLNKSLLSFMLRLGWAPKVDNKENDMLDVDRATAMFLHEGTMKNSPANMDLNKLDAYERKYRAKLGKAVCDELDSRAKDVKQYYIAESKQNERFDAEEIEDPDADAREPFPTGPTWIGESALLFAKDFFKPKKKRRMVLNGEMPDVAAAAPNWRIEPLPPVPQGEVLQAIGYEEEVQAIRRELLNAAQAAPAQPVNNRPFHDMGAWNANIQQYQLHQNNPLRRRR